MTEFLNQSDTNFVRSRFEKEMVEEVKVTLFTEPDLKGLIVPGMGCETCVPTQQLLEEVSRLSEKIQLNIVNYREEIELTKSYGVGMVPTIVFSRDDESNIKYLGIPAGTEFPVLLEAIINVSSGSPNLSEEMFSLQALNSLRNGYSLWADRGALKDGMATPNATPAIHSLHSLGSCFIPAVRYQRKCPVESCWPQELSVFPCH